MSPAIGLKFEVYKLHLHIQLLGLAHHLIFKDKHNALLTGSVLVLKWKGEKTPTVFGPMGSVIHIHCTWLFLSTADHLLQIDI
jgi:hypothetical protein